MSELAAAKEEVSETPVVESTEPAVAAVVAVEVQSPSKVAAVAAGGEEKEKKALQGADELRSFTNNVTRFEDTHLYVGDATFRCDSLKNVPEEVIYVLEQDLGLTQPSPIQINMGLAIDGRSAIAQAQTGSGKTIAFSMVLLSRIDTTKSELQALVLAPTRELIQQIAGEIATLGSRMKPNKPSIKLAVPDGAPKDKKKGKTTKMKYNEQICCGTPGTVNSWVAKGIINLNALRVFVLDEADSMLVDFTNDVTSLSEMIKVCENKRQGENIAKVQILMFSATYSEEARKIYTRLKLLPEDAARMNIELSNLMIENIYQVRMKVEAGKKLETLRTLYDILSVESSIVFVDTKREVDEVAQLMIDSGNAVSSIHGGFDGNERDSIMEDFRQEKTKFLICTLLDCLVFSCLVRGRIDVLYV